MGSSDEGNSKAIDASVGGLVWVRRRNGSWWPGRIMAHHEVPDGTIVSPKSGTPIKLLGRDDASVDWYNLEKSKRVKAFRCGEYDACIEIAKASVSTTSKKAVKYARREDAIAHALEIESAHLAKDNPECIEKPSTSGEVPRRCYSRKGNEDSGDVAETKVALQSNKSLKKTNKVKASKVQTLSVKRRRTPNDSEDDGTEGNKRMRGLEDIGLKGKVQVGAVLEDKQENNTNINGSLTNESLSNGSSRDCSPSIKRNRSPVRNANEYSIRRTRQRPLTKVLESTAMVSVPLTRDELVNSDCSPPPGLSENKVSAVIKNYNSDNNGVLCESVPVSNASKNNVDAIHSKAKESEISNISLSANDDTSNVLFDVPLIGEENYSTGITTAAFTCSSPTKALVSGPTRRLSQSSHNDVVKNEGSNGLIEKSTSKWQLKGKRNSRQMSKKQEERRNAYAEANNNFLSRCSVSDQKLNGHFNPSTVEVLEDGSCDLIVSSHLNPLGVPMVDDAKPKPSSKKKAKKKKSHFPPYKSSKSNKSLSLSIKTRCLSTLSGQKLTVSCKKKVMIEKTKERVVSCIPLKVAFSRINEALKGSTRQVHRALPSVGNT
ncbi:PREDICTED: uncharacterized protein At1g51745-like [Camelina sativa]|uniref:Uncharacterized protein At1g51745-like n=1 Tax=Camelina sativa TaxID=90675 RepID=A0ABM0WAZ7_CAMSA|nr:PREDICTED: uncharacterized protein At1g51745-like [Camelina sativa]